MGGFYLLHGADGPSSHTLLIRELFPPHPHTVCSAWDLLVCLLSICRVLGLLLNFLASFPPYMYFPLLEIPWLWDLLLKPWAPNIPRDLLVPASGPLGTADPCPSPSFSSQESLASLLMAAGSLQIPFLGPLSFCTLPSPGPSSGLSGKGGRALPGLSSPLLPPLSRPPAVWCGQAVQLLQERQAFLLCERPCENRIACNGEGPGPGVMAV